MHYPSNTTDIKAIAIAAIETARALETALDESTVDLRQDTQPVQAMFEAFRAGTLYDEAEEPTLDALSAHVLGTLSDRVPGYRQIALNYDTDNYFFLDEDLESIRNLWEQLRLFRSLRQKVIDQLAAEQHLSALRHRRFTSALE
ncbi:MULTISPECIES: hypothetical protein [Thioclava]|uniref:Uncharacterized protein n=1 Tax=Thioclava indica TaxID=1353528 RepID=A0A074JU71_9RHOB|nr:hypothetical protein [Thioclava indica]KEO60009.1 hypothetical protein DT23_14895 [Thioclava indica]